MNALVFRHPHLKLRQESFGGIGKLGSQLYLLCPNAYNALITAVRPLCYNEASRQFTKNTVDELIENRFLVIIDKSIALKILNERR